MRAALVPLVFVASAFLGSGPTQAQATTPQETPRSQPQAQPPKDTKAIGPTEDSRAPTLWLESGLSYRSSDEVLLPHLRIGFRGIQPLIDTVAIYTAFAIDGDLTLDMGGWYSFLPGADDLFGFRSYAGTGLSYVAGSFGIALSAALSYELSSDTSLILVYTHRPLFFPERSQAFDVSLGVSFQAPR